MNLIENVWNRIRDLDKTIVFPESTEPRILAAANKIVKISKLKVVLLGKEAEILAAAQENGFSLAGIQIIDPLTYQKRVEFSDTLFERRKHKGISKEDAKKNMEDPINFGAMMVNKGLADGCVAGSINPTKKIIKAAIYNIGTAENISTVSSTMVMVLKDKSFGEEGVLFFSDCAVVPDPTSEQLADITMATAKTFKNLIDRESRIALLSFSTKGSGGIHPMVSKVSKAVEILKEKAPYLKVDGEMQLDAALIPSVAKIKIKEESSVAGIANVLIFPDLNSGNIGYKLVDRLAQAEAYGPLLQGLAKPMNDLSRGCSVDDIVNVAALTIAQSF